MISVKLDTSTSKQFDTNDLTQASLDIAKWCVSTARDFREMYGVPINITSIGSESTNIPVPWENSGKEGLMSEMQLFRSIADMLKRKSDEQEC